MVVYIYVKYSGWIQRQNDLRVHSKGKRFLFLIRDAGIRGCIALGETGWIQVREETRQGFSDPWLDYPGSHA